MTSPTAPGMLRNPLPRVTIGDTVVGVTAVDLPAKVVALDGLAIDWGRSNPMSQLDPPTATVQLFDPTGSWSLTALRPGLPVLIEQHAPLQSGTPVAMFRGRVAGVDVTPRTVGGLDGLFVSLSCSSLLIDLANVFPLTAWPAESVAARAARLSIQMGTSGGGLSVTFPGSWGSANVAATDPARPESVWDQLLALFDSTSSLRLTYLPGPHRFAAIARRRFDTLRTLGQLVTTASGARAGLGAYITTVPADPGGGAPTPTAQYLDGGQVTRPDTGVGRDLSSRLTRTRVTFNDAAFALAAGATEALVPNTNEIIDGARVFTQESIVTDAAWAAQQAADLALWANEEQQSWRLPRLHWRVRDGFDTDTQAAQYLAGGEWPGLVFLTGSWLPGHGLRPVFGVIGGTITYTAGAWELDLQPAQVTTTLKQHPVPWDEIDTGTGTRLEWRDAPHPNALHGSVTWDDLKYVGLGLGRSTVPADRGWDVMQ